MQNSYDFSSDDMKRSDRLIFGGLARFGLIFIVLTLCTAGKGSCGGVVPKIGTVIAEYGGYCGEDSMHNIKCAQGLTCLSYESSGASSENPNTFCETPCSTWSDCPALFQCSFVADGPWQVCTRSTTEDLLLCPDAIALNSNIPGVTVNPTTGRTVVEDNSSNYPSDFDAVACGGGGPYDAPEAVYQFQAPATGLFRFWLDPEVTVYDAVLYLSTACPPTTESCVDYDDHGNLDLGLGTVAMHMFMHQGEKILVFVDGRQDMSFVGPAGANNGPFKLVIELD